MSKLTGKYKPETIFQKISEVYPRIVEKKNHGWFFLIWSGISNAICKIFFFLDDKFTML